MSDNIVLASNYNNEAYQYLMQARNAFMQYKQDQARINVIDNQIEGIQYYAQSNQVALYLADKTSLQINRIKIDEQLHQRVETVASFSAIATLYALSALQICIGLRDQISSMLHDNALMAICSFLDLTGVNQEIHNAYKRYCSMSKFSQIIFDINRANQNIISLPGIIRLKSIL